MVDSASLRILIKSLRACLRYFVRAQEFFGYGVCRASQPYLCSMSTMNSENHHDLTELMLGLLMSLTLRQDFDG